MGGAFDAWIAALEARHLANLRVPEMTRALRALSSAYVERRHRTATRGARSTVPDALDSAGKRAAFALFYAPLHFIAVTEAVRVRGPEREAPNTILDLGCGTGAAGAAWALACPSAPTVMGIDRHPWTIDEAAWTYQQLGVDGRARHGDVARLPAPRRGEGIVAAYVLNELPDAVRITVEKRLLDTVERGGRVLIIEPISRGVAPWWEDTVSRFSAYGGHADEWRLPLDLPPLLQKFDRAAGLNHRELTFRSLFA